MRTLDFFNRYYIREWTPDFLILATIGLYESVITNMRKTFSSEYEDDCQVKMWSDVCLVFAVCKHTSKVSSCAPIVSMKVSSLTSECTRSVMLRYSTSQIIMQHCFITSAKHSHAFDSLQTVTSLRTTKYYGIMLGYVSFVQFPTVSETTLADTVAVKPTYWLFLIFHLWLWVMATWS